jgi:hypothetical protein
VFAWCSSSAFAWDPSSTAAERENIRSSPEEARAMPDAETRFAGTDRLNGAREASAVEGAPRRRPARPIERRRREARSSKRPREIGLAGGGQESLRSRRHHHRIVGRILQREINAQDHERLIRDSLTRLLERGN